MRLISELIKNSRRSDRALASVLGVSQPTISRILKKLEKEGYIKGYTLMLEFSKLGFEILAITFAKLKYPLTSEDIEKARRQVCEVINKENSCVLLGMSGIGCDADRVVVSLHEDYSSYLSFVNLIKRQETVEVDSVKSFIVNLNDKTHFLPLNFTGIAGYILRGEFKTKASKL
ncbi:MAG: winged helix-turn-helix transcriptional regulator [Candidatus Bathyarchaeia archaeon]